MQTSNQVVCACVEADKGGGEGGGGETKGGNLKNRIGLLFISIETC
eukprot:COSAG05_NODE_1273_length_5311_cov_11.089793_2_plen_46_part_00